MAAGLGAVERRLSGVERENIPGARAGSVSVTCRVVGGALCVRLRECRCRCATRRRELLRGGITKSSAVFLCSGVDVRAYLLDEQIGGSGVAEGNARNGGRIDARFC
jgi:hypothetical protein